MTEYTFLSLLIGLPAFFFYLMAFTVIFRFIKSKILNTPYKVDYGFLSMKDYERKIIYYILMFNAIIINPAAYTHTSVAIRDALEIFSGTKVEVHLSEVDNRDDFRKINYVRDVCNKCFSGQKEYSYIEAIRYLKSIK